MVLLRYPICNLIQTSKKLKIYTIKYAIDKTYTLQYKVPDVQWPGTLELTNFTLCSYSYIGELEQ